MQQIDNDFNFEFKYEVINSKKIRVMFSCNTSKYMNCCNGFYQTIPICIDFNQISFPEDFLKYYLPKESVEIKINEWIYYYKNTSSDTDIQ